MKIQKSPIDQLNQRLSDEFEYLLKSAHPRALKKHQIARALIEEKPGLSLRELETKIHEFYSIAYERRTERQVARTFRVKPYPWLMQQFVLNFATAGVSETSMVKSAGRFRHLFRMVLSPPEEINSISFLHTVVHRITNPRWDQPTTGIDLPSFANIWRRTTWEKFGERYHLFFLDLFEKVEALPQNQLPRMDLGQSGEDPSWTSELNLTQTDLDWMNDIVVALNMDGHLPPFPLKKGPSNPTTLRIEQLVRAANQLYPQHHLPLEETLRKACGRCLEIFRQRSEDSSPILNSADETSKRIQLLNSNYPPSDR